jgi:hypothetical protein
VFCQQVRQGRAGGFSVGDIKSVQFRAAAIIANPFERGLRLLSVAAEIDYDVVSVARQPEGYCAANASAGASHQCNRLCVDHGTSFCFVN